MTEYLWIPLSLLPSVIVFFVLIRVLGKRIGDTVQWISDARERLERLESEVTQIATQLSEPDKPDPRPDRLAKQLAGLASDLQKERDDHDQRLEKLEKSLKALRKKLTLLSEQKPSAPTPLVSTSDKASLFSSPVAQEVVTLLEQKMPLPDIARKTGLQVGEVDLIRALKFFAKGDKQKS